MKRLRAVLWDVDGTLAETERDGHRVAFNLAFEEAGLPWRWDEARYGELLRVAGGRERLLADMETRRDAPADAAELVRQDKLHLRPGVRALMDECEEQGVAMAITTTTSRSNLDALLSANLGRGWSKRFAAVVCGEDVSRKKPDPEVFNKALERLAVAPAAAIAIEDSPDGAAAARAAGVPVMVTRSFYFADAPIDAAVAIGPGLHTRRGWRPDPGGAKPGSSTDRLRLEDIDRWHATPTTRQPVG
jgi:HAD superfamily hydrolase (TIGR01509 family)